MWNSYLFHPMQYIGDKQKPPPISRGIVFQEMASPK